MRKECQNAKCAHIQDPNSVLFLCAAHQHAVNSRQIGWDHETRKTRTLTLEEVAEKWHQSYQNLDTKKSSSGRH